MGFEPTTFCMANGTAELGFLALQKRLRDFYAFRDLILSGTIQLGLGSENRPAAQ